MINLEQELRAARNNPLLFDGTLLEQEELKLTIHKLKAQIHYDADKEPRDPSWVSAYWL